MKRKCEGSKEDLDDQTLEPPKAAQSGSAFALRDLLLKRPKITKMLEKPQTRACRHLNDPCFMYMARFAFRHFQSISALAQRARWKP